MARYLLALFTVTAVFGLAIAAVATKGAAKKVASYTAECEPKIAFSASKSEAECSDKCKKDSNCRYAIYRKSQCGFVPTSADCLFKQSNDVLLGFTYKKFKKLEQSSPIGSRALDNKEGTFVLISGRISDEENCQALCDFHPACKAAYYISSSSNRSCNLFKDTNAKKAIIDADRGTKTLFVVA